MEQSSSGSLSGCSCSKLLSPSGGRLS
ncbi:hypothetical protein GQ600_6686 [Phytophthora cactorum]|nr:hypothetical protein GQ600_6686 [Phytophthora cactorum]